MRDSRFLQGPISCGFSPDGTRLYAAGSVNSAHAVIRVWDTGTPDLSRTFAHQADVYALAFSNDGDTLAAGTDAGETVLWDAVSGERRHSLPGLHGRIEGLAFDPSHPRLATVSDDSTVAIWDTDEGRLVKVLGPHLKLVSAVAFSTEGTQLATASLDGVVRIFAIPSGEMVAQWQGGHPVWSLAFDRTGGALVVASGDIQGLSGLNGRLLLWDWRSGKIRAARNLPRGSLAAWIAVSPADGRIAVGQLRGNPTVWDPELARPVGELDFGNPLERSPGVAIAQRMFFSRDGSRIFVYAPYGRLSVWDASTFRQLLPGVSLPEQYPFDIALSPDVSRIAVSSGRNVYLLTCLPLFQQQPATAR